MVPRSGFAVENGVITKHIVYIDWSKGFDKNSKKEYIKELHDKLIPYVGSVIDVTSASPITPARNLSPIFVKMKGSNVSVEDFLQSMLPDIPDLFSSQATLVEYIYLSNLTEFDIKFAMGYKCYTDVFHNPTKAFGNTQALCLALLRLLYTSEQMSVLNDPSTYLEWRTNNVVTRIIEHKETMLNGCL